MPVEAFNRTDPLDPSLENKPRQYFPLLAETPSCELASKKLMGNVKSVCYRILFLTIFSAI